MHSSDVDEPQGELERQLQAGLDRLTAGDPNAKSDLIAVAYAQLEKRAHQMLGRFPVVRRSNDTGDVVQEACLRLARSLDAVHPEDPRRFLGLAGLHVEQSKGGEADKLAVIRRERKSAEIDLIQARGWQPASAEQKARKILERKRALAEGDAALAALKLAQLELAKMEQAQTMSPSSVSKVEIEMHRAKVRTPSRRHDTRPKGMRRKRWKAETNDGPCPWETSAAHDLFAA